MSPASNSTANAWEHPCLDHPPHSCFPSLRLSPNCKHSLCPFRSSLQYSPLSCSDRPPIASTMSRFLPFMLVFFIECTFIWPLPIAFLLFCSLFFLRSNFSCCIPLETLPGVDTPLFRLFDYVTARFQFILWPFISSPFQFSSLFPSGDPRGQQHFIRSFCSSMAMYPYRR